MNAVFRGLLTGSTAAGLLLTGWLQIPSGMQTISDPVHVRFVAAGGNCGANNPCYARLQDAVDAAFDGDEIRVAAGRYAGVTTRNGTMQHLYLAKPVFVRGGFHPQHWTQDPVLNPTILDAAGQGRVIVIAGGGTPAIDGFHLTGGSVGNRGGGGGIFVDGAAAILSNNQIYGNYAEGGGGGIYLKNSAATLMNNHIYTNTTGPPGRGGGLVLTDSPSTLQDNIIEDNRAHVGGGIMMNNTLGKAGALLIGNTVRNNVAFDLEEDGRTFDGAGGGIDLSSYLTDTLRDNLISGNTAKWGGGVHAFSANAVIVNNTIKGNYAPYHGGGLYVQGGHITLQGNDVLSNTADYWGGGLYLSVNDSAVHSNLFQGNRAGWGGGLYAGGSGRFDGNRFLSNSAEGGGGIFLNRSTGAIYQNSVFCGNQATEGGGLYLWASDVRLLHSTIANNISSDGRAVVIDKQPGLADPQSPTLYTATVVFSNSIIAGQTVGIFVTPGNSLLIDGVLWWETPIHAQAAGAALSLHNEHTGDPMFQADGYHLRTYSAARDKGKGNLDHDVDGQLRETYYRTDLGADEHVPIALISPAVGGTVTYTNPKEEITITLSVPPGAITREIAITVAPFPPLPPDVLNSPFGKFIPIGPPFRLEAFVVSVPVTNPVDPPIEDNSDIADAVIFEHYPAHVVAEIGVERLKEYYKSMERLELSLFSMLSAPTPPQDPACGPEQRDVAARTLDVPICDTGMVPAPPPPPPPSFCERWAGHPACPTLMAGHAGYSGTGDPDTVQTAAQTALHVLNVDDKIGTGYFLFVIEAKERTVYLPLVMR